MILMTPTTRAELDRMISRGVIAWCMELEAERGSAFHLTTNSAPITLGGVEYIPFDFRVGDLPSGGDGDLTETTITMANVGRIAMAYLESFAFDQGRITLTLVILPPNDSPVTTQVVYRYAIQTATATHTTITITAGQPNYMERPFPPERYIRSSKFPALPRRIG